MPNFEHFATFEESIEMLRDLVANGFRVIAQPGPLEKPSAPTFDSVTDELVAILDKAPVYYLAGGFTRFPVHFNCLKSEPDAGKYLIDFLTAGPLMQCTVGRLRTVEGVAKLLSGDVSYQPNYLNPETKVWEKPSKEVIAAYRKAVSTIKKRCKAVNRRFIAPAALELLETGQARL